jgi:hypothetical protein
VIAEYCLPKNDVTVENRFQDEILLAYQGSIMRIQNEVDQPFFEEVS